MRIKQIECFQFEELSDAAKQKAIENNYDTNVFFDWWEFIYSDAADVGIKLTGFDIDRGSYCEGHLLEDVQTVINKIIENHGPDCETRKTAEKYKKALAVIAVKYRLLDADRQDGREDEETEQKEEFLKDILEDYLTMLRKEYDYQTSEEAIKETIISNEYEFDSEGGRI